MRGWRYYFSILVWAVLCSQSVDASPKAALSTEELRWIENHPVVRFAAESQLPPLEDVHDGRYVGLFASYLEAVSERSGLRFVLVPTRDWAQAQELMLEGKIDMLSNAAPNRIGVATRSRVSFTNPFYASPYIVIAPVGAPIVFRREQLAGKRIAFRSRGANELALSTLIPGAKAVAYPDPESAMRAVADGDADVLVGTEALYPPILRSRHIGTLGVAGMLDAPPYESMFAIRSDHDELTSIVNKSLATITAGETDRFYEEGLAQADYGAPTLRAIARYRALELEVIAVLVVLLASSAAWAVRSGRRAKRSEISKANFLATMSHEIRTPIATVVSAIEAIEREHLPNSNVRKLVGVASHAADSLTDLLDNVLDLSKMDAARLELEQIPTDVDQLFQHAVSAAQTVAREKGILVSFEGKGLNVPLMVDPTRLRQVLANLVGNALKFTDHGAVRISASFDFLADDAGMGWLSVEVSDTGQGIPDAHQAHLFQPYSQADQSTTRRHGGTGLGLAICRELVLLMGGAIELSSHVGVGTAVRFSIPVEATGDRALSVAPGDDLGSRVTVAVKVPASAVRVLVVEDHEVNGNLICGQLAALGVSSQLVLNGRDAVDLVNELQFDMVLMDCHMPVMDGYAATRVIRANYGGRAHLPIIAISSATDATHLLQCEVSGMDGVLRKPIRLTDLAGMLGLWGLEYTQPTAGAADIRLTEADAGSLEDSLRSDALSIADGWLRSDVEHVERYAHRLRGAAAIGQMPELGAIAAELEDMAARLVRPELYMITRLLGEVDNSSVLLRKSSPDSGGA